MTQIGESVSIGMIADSNHDDSCYFCQSKEEPEENENDFDDSPDDDGDLDGGFVPDGMKFKNDASKLGTACGGTPDPKQIALGGNSYNVSVAAHHLIPGNAALKNSELFKSGEYLHTKGMAKGNIGYNVNSSPNGVWLPGNYAIRPWGTKGAAFQAASKQAPKAYAAAAIDKWARQFHDAHEDYSKKVGEALGKIYDKLEEGKDLWCPKAKKDELKPEERSPLYVLVNRLHTVSARMQRMLIFPTSNWFRNVWTSAFSLEYMEDRFPKT